MKIERIYSYDLHEFDEEGFNKTKAQTFAELIKSFEKDFYERNSKLAANYLFARPEDLLKSCHLEKDDPEYDTEIYGLDKISDDLDENFELNHKMDSHSAKTLVYAISTAIDEDEPLSLIRDNSLSPGVVCLKYISNDRGDDEDEILSLPPEWNVHSNKDRVVFTY